MNSFIEILKIILPTIITGIFTFLVTKYSYNKNVPLDKMEIAYDKIYSPIYKMINRKSFKSVTNNTNNLNRLIYEISYILNEKSEYADRSTLRTFDMFYKNKDRETYTNLKNNIINKYLYLRRRLGYLEPNVFQIYKYSSKLDKSFFRAIFESAGLYILAILYTSSKNKIKPLLTVMLLIVLIILSIETTIVIVKYFIFCIKYFKMRLKSKKNK